MYNRILYSVFCIIGGRDSRMYGGSLLAKKGPGHLKGGSVSERNPGNARRIMACSSKPSVSSKSCWLCLLLASSSMSAAATDPSRPPAGTRKEQCRDSMYRTGKSSFNPSRISTHPAMRNTGRTTDFRDHYSDPLRAAPRAAGRRKPAGRRRLGNTRFRY